MLKTVRTEIECLEGENSRTRRVPLSVEAGFRMRVVIGRFVSDSSGCDMYTVRCQQLGGRVNVV